MTQEIALELRKVPAKATAPPVAKAAAPPVEQAAVVELPRFAPHPAPKPVDKNAAAERAAAEKTRMELASLSSSYDSLKRDAREQIAYKEKFMADAERLGVDFNHETKQALASLRSKLSECDSAFYAENAADEKACIPGLKRALDALALLR